MIYKYISMTAESPSIPIIVSTINEFILFAFFRPDFYHIKNKTINVHNIVEFTMDVPITDQRKTYNGLSSHLAGYVNTPV